jgi:hypothetical protein
MFFTPMVILTREHQRELERVAREERLLLQEKRPNRPTLFEPNREATVARSVS